MKTILCTLGMVLFICAALHSCAAAHATEFTAPTCQITGHYDSAIGQNVVDDTDANEDCHDAWYAFGDATGDYGPIDGADEVEGFQTPAGAAYIDALESGTL